LYNTFLLFFETLNSPCGVVTLAHMLGLLANVRTCSWTTIFPADWLHSNIIFGLPRSIPILFFSHFNAMGHDFAAMAQLWTVDNDGFFSSYVVLY